MNWLLYCCWVKALPMEYSASPQLGSSEYTGEGDVLYFYSYFPWRKKKYVKEDFQQPAQKYRSEFTLEP